MKKKTKKLIKEIVGSILFGLFWAAFIAIGFQILGGEKMEEKRKKPDEFSYFILGFSTAALIFNIAILIITPI